jgi:hypothetical protein
MPRGTKPEGRLVKAGVSADISIWGIIRWPY